MSSIRIFLKMKRKFCVCVVKGTKNYLYVCTNFRQLPISAQELFNTRARWFKRSVFSYIFFGFFVFCVYTSSAPQRPAYGTVPFQVANHMTTDKGICGLGSGQIRTQDCSTSVICATSPPQLSVLWSASSIPSQTVPYYETNCAVIV
jgi:hypothetical protein